MNRRDVAQLELRSIRLEREISELEKDLTMNVVLNPRCPEMSTMTPGRQKNKGLCRAHSNQKMEACWRTESLIARRDIHFEEAE